jgi:hypothetical protein
MVTYTMLHNPLKVQFHESSVQSSINPTRPLFNDLKPFQTISANLKIYIDIFKFLKIEKAGKVLITSMPLFY